MDNLNGMHHHPGGGAAGTVGGGCHATPTSNCTTPTNLPDHSVTVTVGGPMLHRSSSSFSNVGSSNPGSFGNGNPTHQINLNASAIVTTTADCCSNVMACSFEETKELLARHLRRCCDPTTNHEQHTTNANATNAATTTTTTAQHNYQHETSNFEGLDLGGDDHTPVPLGDLLEKLQAETDLDDSMQTTSGTKSDINDLIRLHSVEQNEHPTISATVNVATLDLSDPESIHQHLSQLNDAVLRVTTHDNSEDYFDNNTSSNDGNHSRQVNQSNGNTTISISIPGSNPGSAPSIVTTSSMAADNASNSISNSSTPLVSPTHTTIPSSPASGNLGPGSKPKTPSSSPATPRKSGSASGSKASPQSCSVCSKVFSNASALAKHRLTHSEERRYHCNICGKAFKRQDHLNGHLLTHRSTKPFACHVEGCGKSYCDARSLRRHKENHHGQAKAESKQSDTNQTSESSNNKPSNDQLISKSVLGDTKIKFSSKGLTAQQLQLIEQLFKQTKVTNKSESDSDKSNVTTTTTTNNNTNSSNSSNSTTPAVTTTTAIQAPLNAAVKKNDKPTPPLPDKPVECTICSRKFKNIPALNGHMRLHGGYYKKDADGRRLVGMANTSPLKTMAMTAKSNHAKLSSENLKRKANPGDHPGSSLADPQAKKAPAGLSVTYCQPQVTSLPSFAFSNLPQPDTSKLLANLEQKTKQMMNNPGCTSNNTNCNTTTSSLRAMRKQPSFSTSTRNPNDQGTVMPQGAPTMMTNNHQHHHHHHHHSHHQPNLTLPIVALPTKPLPVQMTSAANGEANKSLVQGLNNGTSIQITALIQSNPNPGDFSGGHSTSDFMVQASTQDCGLMNNIPLVNNMLSCMHHQTPSSSTSSLAISSQKSSCTNLLKVDEATDKTPKIGSDHQVEVPPFITDVKPSERAGNTIIDVSMPIWQPETANSLSELEFNQYLVVASSCAVGGGSHNEEVALELLQKHGGNVQYALQDMLSTYDYEEDAMSLFSSPEEASDSEDDSMTFKSGRQPWQPYEVDLFYEGLVRYHKNFTKIARHVGTKSVKDCVEFYYLWKNICHEESQSFKSLFTQSESIGSATTESTSITEAAASSFSTTSTTATSSSTASNIVEIGNGSKNNPTTTSAMEVQSGPSSVSSVV